MLADTNIWELIVRTTLIFLSILISEKSRPISKLPLSIIF